MEPRIIDGQEVMVKVCKPSRRRAHARVSIKKYQAHNSAALWLAQDKGLKKVFEKTL